MLNDVQKHILQVVADMADGNAPGAVNIRYDGQKAYRHNTENIEIVSKTDKDGIVRILRCPTSTASNQIFSS